MKFACNLSPKPRLCCKPRPQPSQLNLCSQLILLSQLNPSRRPPRPSTTAYGCQPSTDVNCKTLCVNFEMNGKKPTKAVCPTTGCGSALTKPATAPTRLCKLGLKRPKPRGPHTVKAARLCWRKSRHGPRPTKAIPTGKHSRVNYINSLNAGATVGT